jgi:CRP/FNR family cyclic AMP-dependent transcriptional regulator
MSFEKEVQVDPKSLPPKIDIGLLKYLWSASPLSFDKRSYHKFFSTHPVCSSFSDNEIRIFTKYIHERKFQSKEIIFRQNDSGYGFYFIQSGAVEIYSEKDTNLGIITENAELIAILKPGNYFGEMGLLEQFNRRDVSAITKKETVLFGIFKPDLEEMCNTHPVLGAKFIREISQIMASKLGEIIKENMRLKAELTNEK